MNEKRIDFLKELKTLLAKYGVALVAEDHWNGYAECGQDVRMTVEFDNWEIEDINLGQYFDKDETST